MTLVRLRPSRFRSPRALEYSTETGKSGSGYRMACSARGLSTGLPRVFFAGAQILLNRGAGLAGRAGRRASWDPEESLNLYPNPGFRVAGDWRDPIARG
jgi:hypothetical protein